MGSDPIRIHVQASDNNDYFFTKEKYVSEAMSLINECMAETEMLLQRNKLLLLKMSEYLTEHSVIKEEAIGEMIGYYGVEPWIKTEGFIKKEQFFNFKGLIRKQINDLEGTPSFVNNRNYETIEI